MAIAKTHQAAVQAVIVFPVREIAIIPLRQNGWLRAAGIRINHQENGGGARATVGQKRVVGPDGKVVHPVFRLLGIGNAGAGEQAAAGLSEFSVGPGRGWQGAGQLRG